MNHMLEILVLVVLVMVALGMVMSFGVPMVQSAKTGSFLSDAEIIMSDIDHMIKEVSEEGYQSTRLFSFDSSLKDFQVYPEEDTISFSRQISSNFVDYGSRLKKGNLISYAGGSVDCYYLNDSIFMENDLILVRMKNLSGLYNTTEVLEFMRDKIKGQTMEDLNLSVTINNVESTRDGEGHSVILRPGVNLPKCTVRYTMNSTVDYNMLFTLYSGADFLSLKIVNLR